MAACYFAARAAPLNLPGVTGTPYVAVVGGGAADETTATYGAPGTPRR